MERVQEMEGKKGSWQELACKVLGEKGKREGQMRELGKIREMGEAGQRGKRRDQKIEEKKKKKEE